MKRNLEEPGLGKPLADVPWSPTETDEVKLRKQLFGDADPEKFLDSYEKMMGVQPLTSDQPKIVYKTVMIHHGNPEDDRLYAMLINDVELYPERKESSSWTHRGEYKSFIVYGENQTVREKRLKEKDKKETEQ